MSALMTPASITVTRNFGDGFVAADVVETPTLLTARPMSGKSWVLTEALARQMGAAVPSPVKVWARKPELMPERGEVGSFIRIPFWRRMGAVKGRKKGGKHR